MLTFSVSILLVDVAKVLPEEDTRSLAGSERDLQKPGSRCGKEILNYYPYSLALSSAMCCPVKSLTLALMSPPSGVLRDNTTA